MNKNWNDLFLERFCNKCEKGKDCECARCQGNNPECNYSCLWFINFDCKYFKEKEKVL